MLQKKKDFIQWIKEHPNEFLGRSKLNFNNTGRAHFEKRYALLTLIDTIITELQKIPTAKLNPTRISIEEYEKRS